MNAKSQVVGQAKDTCGLVRPRFGPGQLLRDDDLKQGVDYTRELSRLLFRSFFGCGVICGLKVTATFECDVLKIVVADGVALNCRGDPVRVCGAKTIVVDPKCLKTPLAPPLWVVLRGNAKCCAPRAPACANDDDEATTLCTREVDGFEIRVQSDTPDCACGCPEPDRKPRKTDCRCADPELNCYKAHYDGECGCECGDCSDCDCQWIVLAKLTDTTGKNTWEADHKYRRFIRPVLIADPLLPVDAATTLSAMKVKRAQVARQHADDARLHATAVRNQLDALHRAIDEDKMTEPRLDLKLSDAKQALEYAKNRSDRLKAEAQEEEQAAKRATDNNQEDEAKKHAKQLARILGDLKDVSEEIIRWQQATDAHAAELKNHQADAKRRVDDAKKLEVDARKLDDEAKKLDEEARKLEGEVKNP